MKSQHEQSHFASELAALQTVLAAIEPLDDAQRVFVISAAASRFGLQSPGGVQREQNEQGTGNTEPATPKEFMAQKKPQSDVERVACLAYFLSRHRGVTEFGTRDLTKINVEAAQPPVGNMSQAVSNATKQNRFLAPVGKGKKQLTSIGEAAVDALPDRSAARAAVSEFGSTRRRKRKKKVMKK